MKDAIDWIETEKPLDIKPEASGRTHLQIVMLAEDTWLLPYLIPTDMYICPSVAIARVRKGATR